MNFEQSFSTSYHVDFPDSPGDSGFKVYSYPGAVEDSWVKGVVCDIYPKNHEPWEACFSSGKISPNAIDFCCSHPNSERLCVVSKGEGYIINTESPSEWESIPLNPIMGALVDKDHGMIVFHDFTRFISINEAGIVWKTPSVSWDGIKNAFIKEGFIYAEIWNAPINKNTVVKINLENGKHEGGSSPEILGISAT